MNDGRKAFPRCSPYAVEVHEVIGVLELQPLLRSEHVAKIGPVPNDIVVTAHLLHAYNVRKGEVEPWRGVVEAGDQRRSVLLLPCAGLHGPHRRVKRGAGDLISSNISHEFWVS